jgi:hypothetical protein
LFLGFYDESGDKQIFMYKNNSFSQNVNYFSESIIKNMVYFERAEYYDFPSKFILKD